MNAPRQITIEPSPKRVRLVVSGKTVADSLCAALLLETGHFPVYYFPREDVRADLLEGTDRHTTCPIKGEASYWRLKVGTRTVENAVWSYEQPRPEAEKIGGWFAFDWNKVDHRFEEDEEVFGHPRDPHHRIDVRRSTRRVEVAIGGTVVAKSQNALFLFETALPARYYIPPADVRTELFEPSRTTTICPYKGTASHWSIRLGDHVLKDVAWSYPAPLPECPRIRDHFCFYPEKVERLEVEGER